MRVKLTSPNWNTFIGGSGNEAGRGKGFGRAVGCSCGMQFMNLPGGQGPAAQTCGNRQTKPNARRGHFPADITPGIVIPHRQLLQNLFTTLTTAAEN